MDFSRVNVRFRLVPDTAQKTVAAMLDSEFPGSLEWLTVNQLLCAISETSSMNKYLNAKLEYLKRCAEGRGCGCANLKDQAEICLSCLIQETVNKADETI